MLLAENRVAKCIICVPENDNKTNGFFNLRVYNILHLDGWGNR